MYVTKFKNTWRSDFSYTNAFYIVYISYTMCYVLYSCMYLQKKDVTYTMYSIFTLYPHIFVNIGIPLIGNKRHIHVNMWRQIQLYDKKGGRLKRKIKTLKMSRFIYVSIYIHTYICKYKIFLLESKPINIHSYFSIRKIINFNPHLYR